MVADYLGKTDDIESYNSDIDKFSKALQEILGIMNPVILVMSYMTQMVIH